MSFHARKGLMRSTLLFMHRWLGLTIGIVFAIASTTGAVLVYQPELNRLLTGGPAFATTPGRIPVAELERRVREAEPGSVIRQVRWPVDGGPITVQFEQGGRPGRLFIDPGGGQVLQPRPQSRLLLALRRVHVNMLIGRPGNRVVVWVTMISLVSLLLGVILWWPGVRRLRNGFRIRRKRGWYLFTFDLHGATGIIAFPLLVLITFTGVVLHYPSIIGPIDRLLGGETLDRTEPWTLPPQANESPPMESAMDASLERIVRVAMDATASGEVLAMTRSPDGSTITVRVRGGDAMETDSTDVIMDAHTAVIRSRRPLIETHRFTHGMVERLHMARYPNALIKLLWSLSCLVGGLLLPTGIIMWWMKRTRLAVSADRRKASDR
jgi:uncharacterized iron-regulated membrane protein